MDEITVENFRCFRDRQTAKLAPLTLLVGENSTGKTSFMALVRALWDIKYTDELVLDFKKDPYDLGSFYEIAHRRGARGGQADYFVVGGTVKSRKFEPPWKIEARFERGSSGPEVTRLSTEQGPTKLEWEWKSEKLVGLHATTRRGRWKLTRPESGITHFQHHKSQRIFVLLASTMDYEPYDGSPTIEDNDYKDLQQAVINFRRATQPYAGAPVRSRPRRTYDPGRAIPDPEGEWVPAYLASLKLTERKRWNTLKEVVVEFGKLTGMFDDIRIWQFGDNGSGPFQIHVRKHDGRLKGPWRNLIDVGYGVSQVLPLLIELVRPDAANMFLMQQPEVHLHPSAQAALGTILCQLASQGKQLIIETHSDHLIDRVRMETRDRNAGLNPEDVSLLYFERKGLDVRIHSLEYDENGNIINAPAGYRQFFMEEVNRSLGI